MVIGLDNLNENQDPIFPGYRWIGFFWPMEHQGDIQLVTGGHQLSPHCHRPSHNETQNAPSSPVTAGKTNLPRHVSCRHDEWLSRTVLPCSNLFFFLFGSHRILLCLVTKPLSTPPSKHYCRQFGNFFSGISLTQLSVPVQKWEFIFG